MHDSNPVFRKIPIQEYPLELLDQITRLDIEEYLEYCTYYVKDGKEYMNDERGKARKLASLRSFYNYFFRNELIEKIRLLLCQCRNYMKKKLYALILTKLLFCWILWKLGINLLKDSYNIIKNKSQGCCIINTTSRNRYSCF